MDKGNIIRQAIAGWPIMKTVYLFRGNHPLYESLVNNPPSSVTYLPPSGGGGREEYSLYNPGISIIRRAIDGSFSMAGCPRFIPVMRKYDLVHSARGFLIVGKNPYVVDFEHVASFAGMRHARLKSRTFRSVLNRFLQSKNCKALLPHSKAAMRTLDLVTDDPVILNKATILYPCVSLPQPRSVLKDDSKPSILYIGEYYWKGGREVLGACMKLASKMDFKLIFVANWIHPPQSLVAKAKELMDLRYIEGPIPRKKLFEDLYPSVDVFAMPTCLDTFGYVFLEAMAHRLPCIGTNHFAVPEIIENDVTGLLVDPAVSFFDSTGLGHPEIEIEKKESPATESQLVSALERVLSSRTLRGSMGRAGFDAVETGKFSVRRRNAILGEVYEKAIDR